MIHLSTRSFLAFVYFLCLIFYSTALTFPKHAEFSSTCCENNVISVAGQGKFSVQPDVAIINIGASVTAKTSQQASTSVAEKINQITSILASNNIKKEDIKTQTISVYPQYEYKNGNSQLTGQTATQILSLTVRGIDSNGGNLGSIIDQLAVVDKVQFNSLNFDKQDKTEALKQARKLAFENAKKKAQNYAEFSGRDLGRVLSINENNFESPAPFPMAMAEVATAKNNLVSTEVPVGRLQVSVQVSARFELR